MIEEEHLKLEGCEDRVVVGCQGMIWAMAMKLTWKLLTAEKIDWHDSVSLWELQMKQMMK